MFKEQWKDKKNSGITLFWFRFVPLLCSIILLLLFLWAKFGEVFFSRRPPTPEEINLPEMEGLLLMLYEIAYGKTFSTIFYVAIIDTIGSYISLLMILYLYLVCLMTIPVLYLRFQEVIDSFIENVSEEKNKLLEVFKSKVLNKIPSATKIE